MDHDVPVTEQEAIETIIDLDRAEILSILRDVQNISAKSEDRVDPFDWHRLR